MKKSSLLELAYSVEPSDNYTSIISKFPTIREKELVAMFCAWLSNETRGEYEALVSLLEDTMHGDPLSAVMAYDLDAKDLHTPCASFYRVFTHEHLHILIVKAREIWFKKGGLYNLFMSYMKAEKNRCKYPHEALAKILGGGTCFPTRKTSGTFYRYNLLLYWLCYNLKIWDIAPYKPLLPCNDALFARAYSLGIINTQMESSLHSAVKLTEKAVCMFGEENYMKMYELLKYAEI